MMPYLSFTIFQFAMFPLYTFQHFSLILQLTQNKFKHYYPPTSILIILNIIPPPSLTFLCFFFQKSYFSNKKHNYDFDTGIHPIS